MTQTPWFWFTEKVLPGLFLAVALTVATAAFSIWQSVSRLTDAVSQSEKRLDHLEVQINNLVTRAELLDTLKRMEQQMQIILLRAGVGRSNVHQRNPFDSNN